MARAIHSMIRVLDEARSVAFYRAAFGLEIADRLDFDSFTLVYMSNAENDFEVELTRLLGLFDRDHYLSHIDPASLGGMTPLRHYVEQGDAAGLATGQAEAAFTDARVQPLRQLPDEVHHLRRVGRCAA